MTSGSSPRPGSGSSPQPGSGRTTVDQLLTPITERFQRQSAPQQPESTSCAPLDATLTHNYSAINMSGRDELRSQQVSGDLEQSYWSATDYFQKYPQGGRHLQPAENSPDSTLPRFNSEPKWRPNLDDSSGASRLRLSPRLDVEFSTMLSSVRPDPQQSYVMVASETDSLATTASFDSISTEDDVVFRAGLAQLDANIARVQRQLRTDSLATTPALSFTSGRLHSSI